MVKKSEKQSNPRAMNTKLKYHEEVFCGCNNLKCEGICRQTHLVKKAGFGYCTAAFNKNNNRDKRVRNVRPKSDHYEGCFAEFN